MDLILIKAVTVICMVLALTYIAENISVKLSGMLAGFPTGSIVTYAFFAIEFGTAYVTDVALYNIYGLVANLCFCLSYYFSSYYKCRYPLLFCLLVSLSIYSVMMLGVSQLTVSIWVTPWAVLAILILAILYLVSIPDEQINRAQKLSVSSFCLRITLTVAIFLIISALPHFVPKNYAGIFSSFPIVLLPVMIIIHFNYSAAQARTIAKNAPLGLPSVVAFSTTVFFTFSTLGAFFGISVALLASITTILLQNALLTFYTNWRAKIKNSQVLTQ